MIRLSIGYYQESAWEIPTQKTMEILGKLKSNTFVTVGSQNHDSFITSTSSMNIFNFLILIFNFFILMLIIITTIKGISLTIKNITFFYICMSTTGKHFISFSAGSLQLTRCAFRIADAFISWEAEARCFNGTFILLGSGSSFGCVDVEFCDILVNGENALISAMNIVKFILDGCSFVRCGCIGDGLNSYGAPVNVELSNGNVDVKISSTLIQDCFAKAGKVQAIYMKGSYDQTYVINFTSFLYTIPLTDETNTIIFLDFFTSSTDPGETSLKQNDTFKNKFSNQCHRMNDSNFMINEYSLNDLICPISSTSDPFLLYGYPVASLDDLSSCSDIEICGRWETVIQNCIWKDEIGIICRTPQNWCEDIYEDIICPLPGMATNKNCIWVPEEQKLKCQEIQNTCNDVLSGPSCLHSGVAVNSDTKTALDCIWLIKNKTEPTIQCAEKV